MRKKNILLSITNAVSLYSHERINKREFMSILNQLMMLWKLKIMFYTVISWLVFAIVTYWLMVFRGLY
jgi:hypothetical protein